MPHGLAGERGAVRNDELLPAPAGKRRMLRQVADPLHVRGREHAEHAGHGLGRGGVDRTDIGEGVRGAHEIGLGLAGHRRIGRVASKSAHQRTILQARLVLRAAFNGLRIHLGFQMRGGALCGEHGYSRKWDGRESVLTAAALACVPGRQGYLFSSAARTRATVSAGVRDTCSTSAATCSPESGSTSILSLSASAR